MLELLEQVPVILKKRSFKRFSNNDFIAAMQKVSLLDVYLCPDASKAASLLTSKITSVLDRMAPMKTVQIRTNYNPWLSQQTKNLMRDRDQLQQIAAETNNQQDWNNYKKLRNTVNNRVKSKER